MLTTASCTQIPTFASRYQRSAVKAKYQGLEQGQCCLACITKLSAYTSSHGLWAQELEGRAVQSAAELGSFGGAPAAGAEPIRQPPPAVAWCAPCPVFPARQSPAPVQTAVSTCQGRVMDSVKGVPEALTISSTMSYDLCSHGF